MERAAILAAGLVVSGRHLPKEIVGTNASSVTPPVVVQSRDSALIQSLAVVEDEHIRHILQQCGGNKTQAAEILGISRLTLRNKLKEKS